MTCGVVSLFVFSLPFNTFFCILIYIYTYIQFNVEHNAETKHDSARMNKKNALNTILGPAGLLKLFRKKNCWSEQQSERCY